MKQQDELKKKAAVRAVDFIESGMVVGLGTGSTANFAIERIGEKIQSGALQGIVGIPTSERTTNLARQLNIPLTDLEAQPAIDLTIDGADEVDPDLNLIKGGGGALLIEKIIAQASRRNIIIVDESKLSPQLGTKWAVPIEVVPFAHRAEQIFLESIGGSASLRVDDSKAPYLTNRNNYILDTDFGPISDPGGLVAHLNQRAGIVEHGLFLALATDVIVAAAKEIRHLRRNKVKLSL
ncbi:MAG: ribose-5-phosphate isomerase RpiA [Desulfobacteraceae bacterium]|nr:ribose-5-phosphate isomerase RpiA [Desulfobacteraceae bacterium]